MSWYDKLGLTVYACYHCGKPSPNQRIGYISGHPGVIAAGLCPECWKLCNVEEEEIEDV